MSNRNKLYLLRVVAMLLVLGAIWLQRGWQEANLQPGQPPEHGTLHDVDDVAAPNSSLPSADANATPNVPTERAARSSGNARTEDQLPADAPDGISLRTVIPNVTVRNEQGRIVFQGKVDLTETLARIERGERLDFRNDGSVFQNRERRLPRKAGGYYREYVHPTPGLSGPGPQRIVRGSQRETYYTHDHYRTFQRLDQPARQR